MTGRQRVKVTSCSKNMIMVGADRSHRAVRRCCCRGLPRHACLALEPRANPVFALHAFRRIDFLGAEVDYVGHNGLSPTRLVIP